MGYLRVGRGSIEGSGKLEGEGTDPRDLFIKISVLGEGMRETGEELLETLLRRRSDKYRHCEPH